MQTELRTAEQWEAYENQIAGDPENLALCVAHMKEARGQMPEAGYRLLALRVTAQRIKPTADFDDLKARQHLRFTFYKNWLDNRRAKMQKLRANPNYKSRRKRALEREWLLYIRWCLRSGVPISYGGRPHGCD